MNSGVPSEGDQVALSTTVDELVRTFAAGLDALVPVMERARVSWRSLDDYVWEDISRCLYRSLVAASVKSAIGVDVAVADYGVLFPVTSPVGRVLVRNDSDQILILHSFKASEANHDVAICWRQGDPEQELVEVSLRSAYFLFAFDGVVHDALEVTL